jgi:hypothetical protein
MKMTDFYKKTTKFWPAVVRVGLPIILLYRVIDYVVFLIGGGRSAGVHYPWRFAVIVDPITLFILSTLWWSLMRSGFGKTGSNEASGEMPHDKSGIK